MFPPRLLLPVVSWLAFAAALPAIDVTAADLAARTESAVFRSGADGYHTFRIPAVIVSPRGDLLAFCEGRKNSRSDTGDIDLVMRRSSDGGKTWSPVAVVWDDAGNTCGNPCPVVDADTGRIWLLLTWNHGQDSEKQISERTGKDTRRVFVSSSDDDGKTWARPADITATAKGSDWTWYATGPGNAIQVQRGKSKGRLVAPCDHRALIDGKSVLRSHCLLSEDHGKTWQRSEPLAEKTNECAVVEREDGSLLLNMRSYQGKNRRAVATSSDGGRTWSDVTLDEALLEPVCQGNILRYDWAADGKPGRILFSNPASTKRERMTIRVSEDDGRTWPKSGVVHSGSAAYSNLVVLPDRSVGLLYERDDYSTITFAVYSIDRF